MGSSSVKTLLRRDSSETMDVRVKICSFPYKRTENRILAGFSFPGGRLGRFIIREDSRRSRVTRMEIHQSIYTRSCVIILFVFIYSRHHVRSVDERTRDRRLL